MNYFIRLTFVLLSFFSAFSVQAQVVGSLAVIGKFRIANIQIVADESNPTVGAKIIPWGAEIGGWRAGYSTKMVSTSKACLVETNSNSAAPEANHFYFDPYDNNYPAMLNTALEAYKLGTSNVLITVMQTYVYNATTKANQWSCKIMAIAMSV